MASATERPTQQTNAGDVPAVRDGVVTTMKVARRARNFVRYMRPRYHRHRWHPQEPGPLGVSRICSVIIPTISLKVHTATISLEAIRATVSLQTQGRTPQGSHTTSINRRHLQHRSVDIALALTTTWRLVLTFGFSTLNPFLGATTDCLLLDLDRSFVLLGIGLERKYSTQRYMQAMYEVVKSFRESKDQRCWQAMHEDQLGECFLALDYEWS